MPTRYVPTAVSQIDAGPLTTGVGRGLTVTNSVVSRKQVVSLARITRTRSVSEPAVVQRIVIVVSVSAPAVTVPSFGAVQRATVPVGMVAVAIAELPGQCVPVMRGDIDGGLQIKFENVSMNAS